MNIWLYCVLNILTFGLLNNVRLTPEVLKVPGIVEDRIRIGVKRGKYIYTGSRDAYLYRDVIRPIKIGAYVGLVASYIIMAVTVGIPVLINTIVHHEVVDFVSADDMADKIMIMILTDNSPFIKEV